MLTDEEFENIKNVLYRMGFRKIYRQESPAEFSWNPDVYAEKKGEGSAFLVREKGEVQDFFIQRMALTKGKVEKLNIYVLFLNLPENKVIQKISIYGIGVALLQKRHIKVLKLSRNFSKELVGNFSSSKNKAIGKVKEMHLYPASHQEDQERKIIFKIVKELRDSHKIPIFEDPIEKNRDSISKLKENMVEGLKKCDIFVGVIKQEDSEWIRFEIKNSFKYFKTNDILIFVKDMSDKTRDLELVKLLKWMRKRRDIHYLPYSNIGDFETTLRRHLYKEISSLYKRKGQRAPFDTS